MTRRRLRWGPVNLTESKERSEGGWRWSQKVLNSFVIAVGHATKLIEIASKLLSLAFYALIRAHQWHRCS